MARAAPRQPGPPAGVIFGCNRSSEEESLNGLFGMSSGHWSLVKEIIPGTPCFLFNFNTKVQTTSTERLASGNIIFATAEVVFARSTRFTLQRREFYSACPFDTQAACAALQPLPLLP